MSNTDTVEAERVGQHFSSCIDQLLALLINTRSEIARAEEELRFDEDPMTVARRLGKLGAEIESVLAGSAGHGDSVEVFVAGSGRVFPEGLHLRRGEVLKAGQTEYCLLVALDEPLGEHEVINTPSCLLAPIDEKPAE